MFVQTPASLTVATANQRADISGMHVTGLDLLDINSVYLLIRSGFLPFCSIN